MSRGHGRIERYILSEVARRPELTALIVMTQFYAKSEGVTYTPHLRASFRRAASNLVDSGAVVGWLVWAPHRQYADHSFGAWRWTLCVGPADMEVTEQDEQNAREGMAVLGVWAWAS